MVLNQLKTQLVGNIAMYIVLVKMSLWTIAFNRNGANNKATWRWFSVVCSRRFEREQDGVGRRRWPGKLPRWWSLVFCFNLRIVLSRRGAAGGAGRHDGGAHQRGAQGGVQVGTRQCCQIITQAHVLGFLMIWEKGSSVLRDSGWVVSQDQNTLIRPGSDFSNVTSTQTIRLTQMLACILTFNHADWATMKDHFYPEDKCI